MLDFSMSPKLDVWDKALCVRETDKNISRTHIILSLLPCVVYIPYISYEISMRTLHSFLTKRYTRFDKFSALVKMFEAIGANY